MTFFIAQWLTLIVGWAAHTLFDRHANRRTRPRLIELGLLWVLVGGGVWALWGGFSHIGPSANAAANAVGFAPSRFQWEAGWAHVAIGVLGIGCAWRRLRGSWLTAAVVVLAISYGGDWIGHIMQLVHDRNYMSANAWLLRSDVLQVVLAVGLLVAYRRTPLGRLPATVPATGSAAQPSPPAPPATAAPPSPATTGSGQPASTRDWTPTNRAAGDQTEQPVDRPSWTVRV